VTVALGVMQLPVTEDADRVRDYLNGTIAGGGLWTALTRSSNHNHTGGNNGTPLSIAAIPDGSITVAKLDPSVLLPYALVDGSKPFTGQVTMQADAIVRDALFFGEQGTALPPDASITRTGAKTLRVDTNLGVGVAPAAWHTARRALQVGAAGSLAANPTVSFTELADNSYLDAAAAQRALVTEAAARLVLQQGSMFVWTAPSVAAGAVQTFAQRLMLDQPGNLGVGVAPAAWGSAHRALQVGGLGALWSDIGATGAEAAYLTVNTIFNGSAFVGLGTNGNAAFLRLQAGGVSVHTAPAAPAGAAQTFTQRLAVSNAGTLALSPDAGQSALLVSDFGKTAFAVQRGGAGSESYRVAAPSASGYLELYGGGGAVIPPTDNNQELGRPTARWTTVYAVAGTINTSLAEAKTGITPLDPGACAQAVLDTDWVSFSYLPPAYVEPPEQEGQAPEDRQRRVDEGRVAHAKMLVETQPARDQKGYVLGSPDHGVSDLFGLSDRKSASPSTDLAVVACAVQDVLRRLAVLEGNG
jgi:hypothetical protein